MFPLYNFSFCHLIVQSPPIAKNGRKDKRGKRMFNKKKIYCINLINQRVKSFFVPWTEQKSLNYIGAHI